MFFFCIDPCNAAPTGYIADRIESRQWPLLGGLVALAGGTALLTAGTNLALWIAGRILQGASTAVVWTAGLAMLSDTFNTQELGEAMGYIGMAMTMGLAIGPLVGGALFQHGGYYSVFGLGFGLIGLDIVARLVMIERKHAIPWLKAEQDQESESNAGHYASSQLEQEQKQEQGKTSEKPLDRVAEAPISTTTSGNVTPVTGPPEQQYPAIKHTAVSRLRTLLSSPRLVVAIWTYLVVGIILTGFDSVLPLFVNETFNWAQTAQGLIFIPIAVPSALDPVVGRIIDRWPRCCRYMCTTSLLCSVPILVCLRFVTHNTIGQKVLLCALIALAGITVASLIMPTVMVEVSCSVQEIEAKAADVFGQGGAMALAYGVLNSAWAAGSVIGPFFAGYIRDDAGWGTMAWAFAVFTGATAVPVLLFMGGALWKTKKDVECAAPVVDDSPAAAQV